MRKSAKPVILDATDRAAVARVLKTPEDALQRDVMDAARAFRWLAYHARPALNRRGEWRTPMSGDPGFLDTVLTRGGRLLFWELKREDGALGPDQIVWFEALKRVELMTGGLVEARVFRPSDWSSGVIERELRREPGGALASHDRAFARGMEGR